MGGDELGEQAHRRAMGPLFISETLRRAGPALRLREGSTLALPPSESIVGTAEQRPLQRVTAKCAEESFGIELVLRGRAGDVCVAPLIPPPYRRIYVGGRSDAARN